LGDLMHNADLQSMEQLVSCLHVINDNFRSIRGTRERTCSPSTSAATAFSQRLLKRVSPQSGSKSSADKNSAPRPGPLMKTLMGRRANSRRLPPAHRRFLSSPHQPLQRRHTSNGVFRAKHERAGERSETR
jgi:hypothetical protein